VIIGYMAMQCYTHSMDKKQIYLGEIKTQLAFSARAFDEFLQSLNRVDTFAIFYHAHHFLIHTTNIDKLFDVKDTSERGRMLATIFAGSDIDLKPFRRLRNHLEHFDERLDAWIKNHDGHAFFDMNVMTGAKGFPQKAFLRAIDGHIFRFYGEDYDLDALQYEIEKISAALIASDKN
jgi:hypothetical protein